VLGTAAAALLVFRSQLGEAHVALVFLLVVLGASASGGRLLGVSTAVASFFLFDWMFLPPYRSLSVRNPLDWLVLAVFLITSIVAAQLLYLARAERAAIDSADSLREADRLKDALLASVSHDLRTPLTTIKGLAHELQELGDERTLIIEEQADRLNALVADLLEMARLNGGALKLDTQVNAVDDLLGAIVQHVAARPDRHRVIVTLDDPATLLFGRFDFVHSLRILANLVDNALQHGPVDTPIHVTGGAEGDEVVIRVSDEGPGVPEKERERIFAPFYRGAEGMAKGESSGLGLTISRGLAVAQSGSLECVVTPDGGTLFELRLPGVNIEEPV
jgi:two-component system sensor histidine kinase KdpD